MRVILDFGHGGITEEGLYTTAPDKMYSFPDGFTIYEGQINRLIGYKLTVLFNKYKIEYDIVSEPVVDTPLRDRVRRADSIFALNKDAWYLSIHSNAGGGRGFEIWTSRGQTKSDLIADIFANQYIKHFPEKPYRKDSSDGDYDKEAGFYVLRKTDCPAILVENLFFDNREEAEYLASVSGQQAIANCLMDGVMEVKKELYEDS